MNRYTIYCTVEQAKKALEFGAPLDKARVIDTIEGRSIRIPKDIGEFYLTPTAEQMIGWLEDKGISVKASCFSWINKNKPTWQVHAYQSSTNFWEEIAFGVSTSCKAATLAAIDAALDYLIKNKK